MLENLTLKLGDSFKATTDSQYPSMFKSMVFEVAQIVRYQGEVYYLGYAPTEQPNYLNNANPVKAVEILEKNDQLDYNKYQYMYFRQNKVMPVKYFEDNS